MDAATLIEQRKQETQKAKEKLLKTFQFVPEDRLNWSPSPTARTALRIAAHCGAANETLASLLRGDGWPLSMDPEEAEAQILKGGDEIKTREEAVRYVEESAARVIEALEKASPEQFDASLPTAFGPLSFWFCAEFPGAHMHGHAFQINYLQTLWGDSEDY